MISLKMKFKEAADSAQISLLGRILCVFASMLLILAASGAVLLLAAQDRNKIALSKPLVVKWQYESEETSNLTPALDGDMIYLPLSRGVLVSLLIADGKLNWRAETGGEFSAAPTVDDKSIYVAGQYSESEGHVYGTLRALSKTTGVTLWMRTLPAPLKGALAANEKGLFGAGSDGRVYAFDKQSGLTIWINQFGEGFSCHPAFSDKLIYFGGENGALLALDQATGKLTWLYRADGAIQGSIVVDSEAIYFGSNDGNIYALNRIRHKVLWRRRTGAAVQAVTVVDNGLLAASLDNFAYLLSRNKGSLIWRRLLPGRISSQPVTAPDGALFTPLSTDSAIVLNLRDGKPANTLSLGQENSSSAAPVLASNAVLITTPHGLLAFAPPQAKSAATPGQ